MKQSRLQIITVTILLLCGLSIMPVHAEEETADEIAAIQTESGSTDTDSGMENESAEVKPEEIQAAESVQASPEAETDISVPAEEIHEENSSEGIEGAFIEVPSPEIPTETPDSSITEPAAVPALGVVTPAEVQPEIPEPVQQEPALEESVEAELPDYNTEAPQITADADEPAIEPVSVPAVEVPEITSEANVTGEQEFMTEDTSDTVLLPEATGTKAPEGIELPVAENDTMEEDSVPGNTVRKELACANAKSAAGNAVPVVEGVSAANENVSTEELSSHAAVYVIEAPAGTVEETTGYIQQRLDQAKNNQTEQNILVKILSGNYYVGLLNLYSNTDLVLSNDARMIRNNAGEALLRGYSDGNETRNVLVRGGIWEGNGTEGDGATEALIDFRNVFNLTLHDLVIKNTAKTLVRVEDAGQVSVESVKFEGGATGLKMINAENAVIRNNTFTGQTGNAAAISGSNGIEVRDNTIAYCCSGIELSGVTGSSITGNTIKYTEDSRNIVLKDRSVNNAITENILGGSSEVIADNTSKGNTISGNTVFLGELVQTEEGIKYQNNDRSYYKDGWKKVNGATYYFSETSGAAYTGWKKIDGKKYHFKSTGVMDNGWRKISGHQYHFTKGVMDTGWKTINNYTYYFNWKGVMTTGLTEIETKKYYFNDKGCMQTGWNKVDGATYYFNPETGDAYTGWKKIDGKQYHFQRTGVMDSGWRKISGHQYHFTKGVMDTGWKVINNYKYYFSNKGVMSTGLTEIEAKKYYFNDKGCMQTGWNKVDGKTYLFNLNTGAAYTGWFSVNGSFVFLMPEKVGNRYYFHLANAYMLKGKKTIKGKEYYFNEKTGVLEGNSFALSIPKTIPSNVLNILNYGAIAGDGKDDTRSINNAIGALTDKNRIVYVPAGNYTLTINKESKRAISFVSNMSLIMDPKAVLKVKGNSINGDYQTFDIRNVSKINIIGGQIIGDRLSHTVLDSNNPGESGHGISVIDSKNVHIAYTSISNNWGDGLYLGTASIYDKRYGCNNLTVKSCTFSNNRRNNITLVDADNVTIDGCTISNAGSTLSGKPGTAPNCGIDIEPCHTESDATGTQYYKEISIPKDEICKRIRIVSTIINVFKHTKQDSYNGLYFALSTIYNPYNDSYISANDLFIRNCTLNGDVGNYSATNAKIINTIIKGALYDTKNTKLTNVTHS